MDYSARFVETAETMRVKGRYDAGKPRRLSYTLDQERIELILHRVITLTTIACERLLKNQCTPSPSDAGSLGARSLCRHQN